MAKLIWFIVGSRVQNRSTGAIGEVLNIKGSGHGKDSRAQVKWENGLTTWHRNRELKQYRPS